jgi:hypothetical protein
MKWKPRYRIGIPILDHRRSQQSGLTQSFSVPESPVAVADVEDSPRRASDNRGDTAGAKLEAD